MEKEVKLAPRHSPSSSGPPLGVLVEEEELVLLGEEEEGTEVSLLGQ